MQERTLSERLARVEQIVETLRHSAERIERAVIGNGDSEKPSMLVRIDRIEQQRKGLHKGLWVAVSTAIACAVHYVLTFLHVNKE
jgi:Holliday junction resolvasome RuvABC endonuclease subunit